MPAPPSRLPRIAGINDDDINASADALPLKISRKTSDGPTIEWLNPASATR